MNEVESCKESEVGTATTECPPMAPSANHGLLGFGAAAELAFLGAILSVCVTLWMAHRTRRWVMRDRRKEREHAHAQDLLAVYARALAAMSEYRHARGTCDEKDARRKLHPVLDEAALRGTPAVKRTCSRLAESAEGDDDLEYWAADYCARERLGEAYNQLSEEDRTSALAHAVKRLLSEPDPDPKKASEGGAKRPTATRKRRKERV